MIPQINSPDYFASLLLDGETLMKTVDKEFIYYAKLSGSFQHRTVITYDDSWDAKYKFSYTQFITSEDFINWSLRVL